MRFAKSSRKWHRLGALLIAAPLLVVIVTGILLQLKKELAWVQPPTAKGTASAPSLPFESILAVSRGVPELSVDTWDDIERLDVRPDKGIVKVRAKNHYEAQLDTLSGEVLHVAYRRSDLIESLHDGSWFHSRAKLALFLPTAVILFGLWVTGIYLWWLPHGVRRRRNRDKSTQT